MIVLDKSLSAEETLSKRRRIVDEDDDEERDIDEEIDEAFAMFEDLPDLPPPSP